MTNIGDRIREVRKHLGLTQREFADRLGIKGPYVSELEKGKKYPSGQLIHNIWLTFSLNREWLENGEGVRYKTPGQPHDKQLGTHIVHSAVDDILREGDIVKITAIEALLEVLKEEGDRDKVQAVTTLLLRLSPR